MRGCAVEVSQERSARHERLRLGRPVEFWDVTSEEKYGKYRRKERAELQ